MTVTEAIGIMFAFGMLLIALLTCIDRNQKKEPSLSINAAVYGFKISYIVAKNWLSGQMSIVK